MKNKRLGILRGVQTGGTVRAIWAACTNIWEQTYYGWKRKNGEMEVSEARRLRRSSTVRSRSGPSKVEPDVGIGLSRQALGFDSDAVEPPERRDTEPYVRCVDAPATYPILGAGSDQIGSCHSAS